MSGDLAGTCNYGPYGEKYEEYWASNDYEAAFGSAGFGYKTEYRDETNLVYYGARYYSPVHGRFISRDPLGEAASGANLYAYCHNDPINRVEIYGMFNESAFSAMGNSFGQEYGRALGLYDNAFDDDYENRRNYDKCGSDMPYDPDVIYLPPFTVYGDRMSGPPPYDAIGAYQQAMSLAEAVDSQRRTYHHATSIPLWYAGGSMSYITVVEEYLIPPETGHPLADAARFQIESREWSVLANKKMAQKK